MSDSTQIDTDPFRIVSTDFKDKRETIVEIHNMPRVRSQDSLPLCYAFSAATIAQKKACDADDDTFQDRSDPNFCSKIPPLSAKEISPFSMMAWAKAPIGGGDGASALDNSHRTFSFIPESCLPFDQIANNITNKDPKAIDKLMTEIDRLYNKNRIENENKKREEVERRGATEAGVAICESCSVDNALVRQINDGFGIVASVPTVFEALEKETFSEFLYSVMLGKQALLPKCKKTGFIPFPRPKFDEYPKRETNAKKRDLLPKIIEVLKTKNPIQVGGVCLQKDLNTGGCKISHAIVVSGHKQVCNPLNQCRDLVKVHNSWGAEWQRKYNNGWVDAQTMIENIDDSPALVRGTLSWLL
ncbi:MAG: hypothetical protein AABY53_02240 [Bdellovibrionota bacterium]